MDCDGVDWRAVIAWCAPVIRLAALLALTCTAAAASNCAPSEAVEMRLASLYAEVPVGAGMKRDHFNRQTVVRLWVSEKGTFTITETSPQGVTCVLMAGREFYLGPPDFPKPGDPG